MNQLPAPAQMLVAEDIYLLILDDQTGSTLVDPADQRHLIACALVVDLVLTGSMAAEDDPKDADSFILRRQQSAPLTDELLRQPATAVDGKTLRRALGKLSTKRYPRQLADRLIRRGHVRRRLLRRTLPQLHGAYEHDLRASLLGVLQGQREPDYRETTLIALLVSVGALTSLFSDALNPGVMQRATDIAETHWVRERQPGQGGQGSHELWHGLDAIADIFGFFV